MIFHLEKNTKNLDAQCVFFHLNSLSVQGVLGARCAQAIFCQFSNPKNGGQSQQPSALCQLVTDESHHTRISCPKETNLIF